MRDDAAFWNAIAPRYAQDPIKDMASYTYTLERTRSFLNFGSRVLEVGCGTGTSALQLSPSVRSIVACDLSEGMISIAREKLLHADAPRNVSFQVAPISSAGVSFGQFDAAVAFNVLHLVPDLDEALTSVAERVRSGGLFISKTPCLGDSSIRLLKPGFKLMRAMGKAPHVSVFTRKTLRQKITSSGFDIVEFGDFPRRPPRHFVVARRS